MNKSQLIKAVAEKSQLAQKQVGETWKLFEDTILSTLTTGEKVQLSGFGTFEVRERAERTGINPQTKQTITIAASKNPVFKAGKALKDTVSK